MALATGAVAALGYTLTGLRSGKAVEQIARGLALATTTAAVVWAPTLYEQFTHSPGNLGLLWNHFMANPYPGQPWHVALSAWADMMTGPLRPDFYLAHGWRFVESPVPWAESVAAGEMLVLGASVVYARRHGRHFDAALGAVLLGASLLSLWTATRIDGDVFDHAVFWVAAIGTLNLAVVASVGLYALGLAITDRFRRLLAPLACAVTFLVTLLCGSEQLTLAVQRSHAPDAESRAAEHVALLLRRELTARGLSRPLIRFDQDAWGMAAGVVLRLQKEGVAVAVEDDWLAMYTPAFAATGQERAEVAIVGKAAHTRLDGAADTVIAASGDLLFAHLTMR